MKTTISGYIRIQGRAGHAGQARHASKITMHEFMTRLEECPNRKRRRVAKKLGIIVAAK